MELMSGGPSAAQLPASYRHLLGAASTDAFIVSIESVRLTQTDGNSQGHRCTTQRVHVLHTHMSSTSGRRVLDACIPPTPLVLHG